LLPAALLARRKQGFSPPFSAWARGPLRAQVSELLSRERVARAGVLDPAAVRDVLDAHLDHRSDRGRTLWTLLSLQMWAERWVLGGSGTAPAAGRDAEAATSASTDEHRSTAAGTPDVTATAR
jgi:asparagine synthase (glutamine-hydrolysing)